MAVTPEGKIKKLVNRLLDNYEDCRATGQGLYRFWPVPAGFGASSLDCLVCYRGTFIAIETKAPGKKPTPRQELCMAQIHGALGHVFVVDSEASLEKLEKFMNYLRNQNAADNS